MLWGGYACNTTPEMGSPSYTGDWSRLTEIIDEIKHPSIPERTFTVTDFGDENKLRENMQPALQEAINRASSEGGGKVVIPDGEWISKGPIHLRSSIEMHISEGTLPRFSDNPGDYLPQVLVRWEGTEAFNLSPLIYAYQASDIAITGSGTVDGNSEYGFATWRPEQSEAQSRLRTMGGEGVPVFQRVFDIEDITLIDSPMWVMHMVCTSHGVVRGVTVNRHRLNNDGIVLDSSEMFLVENNSFTTGDDSVVIKSGRDQAEWLLRWFSTDYHSHLGQRHPVRYRDILFENIKENRVNTAFFAEGVSEEPIQDVYINNMTVGFANTAIDTTYVRTFNMTNVEINTENKDN